MLSPATLPQWQRTTSAVTRQIYVRDFYFHFLLSRYNFFQVLLVFETRTTLVQVRDNQIEIYSSSSTGRLRLQLLLLFAIAVAQLTSTGRQPTRKRKGIPT